MIGGLVLPGGGARGSYQVGVLKAIAELVHDSSQPDRNPFPVISGASAGAINATVVASHAHEFTTGIHRLEQVWANMHAAQIYRTDWRTIAGTGLRWLGALTLGGIGPSNPKSLLNNAPLRDLLETYVRFDLLDHALASSQLHGLAITASGYTSALAMTFYHANKDCDPWERTRRIGVPSIIGVDHLLASSALPFVFPATRIGKEYFGDGSLRLTAPLSAPIRLGASKLLVIGVRDEKKNELPSADSDVTYPSMGDIGGYMLDNLFMDNLNADIERLVRINETLALLNDSQREQTSLKSVDVKVIRPSRDVREIAKEHAHTLPRSIRTLFKSIGAWGSGWRMPSYLLFEGSYTRAMIELGYQDGMRQAAALSAFLEIEKA